MAPGWRSRKTAPAACLNFGRADIPRPDHASRRDPELHRITCGCEVSLDGGKRLRGPPGDEHTEHPTLPGAGDTGSGPGPDAGSQHGRGGPAHGGQPDASTAYPPATGRGWRVIDVEFRGSTGFGWRHVRAGWQQSGPAMQDDLADAVTWAAQSGWVDPRQVCIFGSSYGGHAPLMGPIRHPSQHRCAASYGGVTDIELMFAPTWGGMTEQHKRHSLPALVGESPGAMPRGCARLHRCIAWPRSRCPCCWPRAGTTCGCRRSTPTVSSRQHARLGEPGARRVRTRPWMDPDRETRRLHAPAQSLHRPRPAALTVGAP